MLTRARRCQVGFVTRLADHGAAPALVGDGEVVSYADLAARVERLADRLAAGHRKICVVPLERRIDSVVGYLAVLAAGHVAVVVAEGRERTGDGLQPDLLVDGERIVDCGAGPSVAPHPDAAVLLSTSGSTGSAKLVALSGSNLQANAEAIAEGLGLRGDDRAITSLPLFYCYGLSVLHSHLAAGASVVLSEAPVNDARFWRTGHEQGVTTISGVPHSFAMMRSVLPGRELAQVRRFTCAGGRLAPDDVLELSALGRERGWDLFVMYGQTEATARMAILRPDDAVVAPGSVGCAIPGGRFEIDCSPDSAGDHPGEAGEVVYHGPNVMLGYAGTREELAACRPTGRLRTGDIGFLDTAGRLHIVGRKSGFVKILGKRIDLEQVERVAREISRECCVVGDDDGLLVACVLDDPAREDDVRRWVLGRVDLPPGAVRVDVLAQLPRLASGKVDRHAVRERLLARPASGAAGTSAPPATDQQQRLLALYRDILERPHATAADSFTSLGGDSLSFVELSVRLEEEIGTPPEGWQDLPVAVLARSARRPGRWAAVETSVVLRALAALTILGTHIGLFTLLGGAHTLLAVLGFNIARFGLSAPDDRERTGRLVRTAAGIAVPTVIWVIFAHLTMGAYAWPNMMLSNWLAGSDGWGPHDQLWFIESAVWSVALIAALFAVPAVRRRYASSPSTVVWALLAGALVPRFVVLPFVDGPVRGLVPFAFWLIALGMAAATVRRTAEKVLLSVVSIVAAAGFYGLPGREAYIVLGILALIWVRNVRMPRRAVPAVALVASASLYIYLIQWQVFPHIGNPLLAFAGSVAAGICGWWLARRVERLWSVTRETKEA